MKQKRHTTEEIIRILREIEGRKDPEAFLQAQRLGRQLLSLDEKVWRHGAQRRP